MNGLKAVLQTCSTIRILWLEALNYGYYLVVYF